MGRRHLTAKDYYNCEFVSDPTAANARHIYILSMHYMHSSHRLLQIKEEKRMNKSSIRRKWDNEFRNNKQIYWNLLWSFISICCDFDARVQSN